MPYPRAKLRTDHANFYLHLPHHTLDKYQQSTTIQNSSKGTKDELLICTILAIITHRNRNDSHLLENIRHAPTNPKGSSLRPWNLNSRPLNRKHTKTHRITKGKEDATLDNNSWSVARSLPPQWFPNRIPRKKEKEKVGIR